MLLWAELSTGRVVHGARVYGESCLWDKLSMGQVDSWGVLPMGTSCVWSVLSVRRVFHGASYPWGELIMGRVVSWVSCRRVVHGALSMGRISHHDVHWASCP
jgi:hypothetical protein